MKKNLIIIFAFIFVFSCKEKQNNRVPVKLQSNTYDLFGHGFETDSILSIAQLSEKAINLGDTLKLTLKGKIKDVCSKKGCWMTLSMPNETDMMVRFKDYGFFVPLDASGEVIVNGKAFFSETSIEDLRHYAEDAGASAEDIAAIVSSKVSYNFEADGVLISQ
ncbi:MAG: DUF4920 domain-containing protein [Bacteroidetes bacterium]|nr:DUF4920 domain-containing protein [Bacteroidota bacterium]MDA1176654.1 DUF4920 domain-containing protein [Bacteroidota bacterium]